MKTFRITIPKVHCVKKNDLLNKDKIFIVVIVTSLKPNENPKIIFSGISGITDFRKKDIKNLNLGTDWKFDVNEEDTFNITFGLYELDRGDIYQSYQEKITEITTTSGMNYLDVINLLWDELKQKALNLQISDLILFLPSIGLRILKDFRKDDLIGKRSFSFTKDDPNINFVPEFDLTDSESYYKIQLKVEELSRL